MKNKQNLNKLEDWTMDSLLPTHVKSKDWLAILKAVYSEYNRKYESEKNRKGPGFTKSVKIKPKEKFFIPYTCNPKKGIDSVLEFLLEGVFFTGDKRLFLRFKFYQPENKYSSTSIEFGFSFNDKKGFCNLKGMTAKIYNTTYIIESVGINGFGKKFMENLHKTWMENWRNYGSYNDSKDPIFFLEKSMVSKLFLILKDVADGYSDSKNL